MGQAQLDHVNYVTLAQFLVDEPYSTRLSGIGLRPWLWRAVELKEDRITECMAVGVASVCSGLDAQRAWGATAVFFTGLLGLALAGMWRVAGSLPGRVACLLGLAGALAPVVTRIYLLGFFSQLTSLFVFPALIAVCRPGALPRRTAIALATVLLGFLAGAYTEFWPIGLGVAGAAILGWRLKPLRRVLLAAAPASSLLLTGAYMTTITAALIERPRGIGLNPSLMSAWAPGGISWHGWGWSFFPADAFWAKLLGLLGAAGMLLGVGLQPRHRRWHWGLVLAAPVLLVLIFLGQPRQPVYATYKLLAEFAPVCLGLAVLGWARASHWLGDWPGRVVAVLFCLGGLWVLSGGVHGHLQLVDETRRDESQRLRLLWAARERAENAPGSNFLVASGNSLVGAWLAYFARGSNVYYDLPAVSDRRAPSESASFRKIPAGPGLEWLDLDRSGPVLSREPSPVVKLQGARDSFALQDRPVFLLGGQTELILTRAEGFTPTERVFVLECGLMAAPGAGPSLVVINDRSGTLLEVRVEAAMPLSLPLRALPGRNVYTVHARPVAGDKGSRGADRDLLLLQALSIESASSREGGVGADTLQVR